MDQPRESFTVHPIGIVHSPFTEVRSMPIQPRGALGTAGTLEVFPEFEPGLKDLSGFSHLILLYRFHAAPPPRLQVVPFLDAESRGIFATRAPARPNALGLSVVRLVGVSGPELRVENLDLLDGTPLLDIKPYVPAFDHWEVTSLGWLTGQSDKVESVRSDARFHGR